MTKINENPNWEGEIHQIDRKERVSGGRDGVANIQARQLANRTCYLKQMLEGIASGERPYQSAGEFQKDIDDNKIALDVRVSVRGDAPGVWLEEYQNKNGVATPTGNELPNYESWEKSLPSIETINNMTPLFKTEAGEAVYFINADGLLDGPGAADNMTGMRNIKEKIPDVTPLFVSEIDDFPADVPVWDGTDGFNISRVGKSVSEGLRRFQLSTDGRTAYKHKANRAKAVMGMGVTRIACFGDSWSHRDAIPLRLKAAYSELGECGTGFISAPVAEWYPWGDVVMTSSGWTKWDASAATAPPPYSCGPDGAAAYTSRNDAKISITNVVGTTFSVFYYDLNGTFKYKIDNGDYITVVGTGTGKILESKVSGLSREKHLISVDTTGNNGVICITMFHAVIEGASGLLVHKCGNGGMAAFQTVNYMDNIKNYSDILALDVAIVFLGTNDDRLSVNMAEFKNYYAAYLSTLKNAFPNVSIIAVAPAQHGFSDLPARMSVVRDIISDVACENGYEFYSAYDYIPPHGISNPLGVWDDQFHVNIVGADMIAQDIVNKILRG